MKSKAPTGRNSRRAGLVAAVGSRAARWYLALAALAILPVFSSAATAAVHVDVVQRLAATTPAQTYPDASACGTVQFPAIDVGSTPLTPGRWWNPKRVGTGWDFHFTLSNTAMYAVWYTYDSLGRPVWYQTESNQIFTDAQGKRWGSALLKMRRQSGQLVSEVVGSVGVRFYPNDPTRAALTWELNGVAVRTECVFDYFRAGPQPTSSLSAKAANTTYSGAWYEEAFPGYGVMLAIGQPSDERPSRYVEFDVLTIYDDVGNPVWVVGESERTTTPPASDNSSRPIQMAYYRSGSGYGNSYPLVDCTDKNVCISSAGSVGTFVRKFTSASTAEAQIAINATNTQLRRNAADNVPGIHWNRPDTGQPYALLSKLTESTSIFVDRLSCQVLEGQTTCPISINWSGGSYATARAFRRNLVTSQLTMLSTAVEGEYVDNLAVGARVQYELHYNDNPASMILSRSPEVRAVAAPVVVVPDQPVESLSGELPTHEPTVRAISGRAGTSGGAATYEIPLVLPPGRRGMEPKLSLTYSSRAGNGLLGMGWSLSGLSSIHRCPSTPEQDGKVQAVAFTTEDRLCLDGQRLVLRSDSPASYNVAGSTYATEIDSFSRITLLGDNAGSTSYFKVETKGGETLYYGGESPVSNNARIAPTGAPGPVAWYLVARRDSVGNDVRYTYRANPDGEMAPFKIMWTGFGADAGNRSATFFYEGRPGASDSPGNDNSSSYVAGGLTRQSLRLVSIRLAAAGEAVGDYSFTYGNPSAHSGRSLLRSIQHCSHAALPYVCEPPTTISWQEASPSFQLTELTVPTELLGNLAPPVDNNGDDIPDANNNDHRAPRITPSADFNGDGTKDAVWTVPGTTTDGASGTYLVLMGPDRSVLRYFSVPASAYLLVTSRDTADYNNDGRVDLTGYDATTGRLFVKIWSGPESAASFDAAYATTIDTLVSATYGAIHFAGDMNGDGRADLVVREDSPGGPATCKVKAKVYLNTGTATAPIAFSLAKEECLAERVNLGVPSVESVERVADFDADGLPDIWINGAAQEPEGPSTLNRILFGTRVGATYSWIARPFASLFPASSPPTSDERDARLYRQWIDVNGDGLDDFLFIRLPAPSAPKWALRLNTGKGLGNLIEIDSGLGIGPCAHPRSFDCNNLGVWTPRYAGFITPFDYDSDGRPELLFPASFAAQICDRQVIYSGTPQCDIPLSAEDSPLGATSTQAQICREYFVCPENPSTGELDPITGFGIDENRDGWIDDINQDGKITTDDAKESAESVKWLYRDGGGFDRSLYYMNALQFVETAKDTFKLSYVQTSIIRSRNATAVDDVHGDGLTDALLLGGCDSPNAHNCIVPLFTTNGARFPWVTSLDPQNPDGPPRLPNGAPLMKRAPFVVENKGAGTNPDGKTPKLPDLVQAVTDGLGSTAVWTYYPLSTTAGRGAGETPLYSMPPFNARYTDERHFYFQSSMPVVAEMAVSNGIGGYRSVQYGYGEAMYNHQGRGFQGFRTVIEEDEESRVRTTTKFHQKFPLTGRVDEVFVNSMNRSGTDAPFRKEKHHWRCNRADRADTACLPTIGSPTVKFPYLDATEATTYDAATAEAASGTPEEIAYQRTENVYRFGFACTTYAPTGTSGYDAYGNLTGSINLVCDRGSKAYLAYQRTNTQRTFTPVVDATTWWPDKLVNEMSLSAANYTAAHAVPAGVSWAQSSVFKNWAWNSDRTLASEQTQDGSDNSRITTTYGYPAGSTNYGLPTSVSVAATGDQNAGARVTTMTYSADGYFPASVTNPMGHVTRTTTRVRDGQPSLTIDPNGLRTIYQYDALGGLQRVLHRGATDEVTRMPDEALALSNCAGNCAPNARYKVTKVRDGAPTSVTHYDLLGRVVREETTLLDGTRSYVDTSYDARGLVTRQTEPYRAGSTSYGTTFFNYDVLGRPRVKVVQKQLDAYGDLRTEYTYAGRETRIRVCGTVGTRCIENISRLSDALGRHVETTDALGGVTKYWYDGTGQALALRDAKSSVISATYNALGHRKTLSDPNMGAWTFTYNALGEVLTQRDARGITTSYAYDKLGRRTSKTATYDVPGVGTASDTVLDTWSYDAPNARGAPFVVRRTVNAAIEREETFEYDTLARPVKTTTVQNMGSGATSTFVSSVLYDGYYGRPKQQNYANGERVAFSYAKYGQVTREYDAATGSQYRRVNLVNGRGQVTNETLGDVITSAYAYTGTTGQLTNVTHTTPSTTRRLDYRYDVFGNVVRQELGATTFEDFTYDNLHRLKTAVRSGGATGSVSYGYDAVGNFSWKSDFSQGTAGAYGYGGSCGGGPNAVKSVALASGGTRSYCYDANGNLKSDTAGLVIDYDHDNLPIRIVRGAATSLLAYGANGERVRQGGTDGTRLYFGAYERITTTGSADKVHLGDYGVITYDGTRRVDYFLKDRLGSVDTVVDSTGAAKENRGYDPFGKPRSGTWADLTPPQLTTLSNTARGFTQHEHLNAVQLIHMNGRSFDYSLGRFLSVDPIIQFPTNSQSLNPYSYILNNPLSGTDPSGYAANTCDVGANKSCLQDGENIITEDGKTVATIHVATKGQHLNFTTSNGASFGATFTGRSGEITRALTGKGIASIGEISSRTNGTLEGTGFTSGLGPDASRGTFSALPEAARQAGGPRQSYCDSFTCDLSHHAGRVLWDMRPTAGFSQGYEDWQQGNYWSAAWNVGTDLPIGKLAKGMSAGAGVLLPLIRGSSDTLRAFKSSNFRENLGRLTGNIPFGSQAHHVFPQKFAERFEKLGINVHDPRFGAWWDAVDHGKHSRAYNDAWDEFFRGNPSQQGALDFARKLATDYGYRVNF
jgi:RHS repeat-associated protein